MRWGRNLGETTNYVTVLCLKFVWGNARDIIATLRVYPFYRGCELGVVDLTNAGRDCGGRHTWTLDGDRILSSDLDMIDSKLVNPYPGAFATSTIVTDGM